MSSQNLKHEPDICPVFSNQINRLLNTPWGLSGPDFSEQGSQQNIRITDCFQH